MIKKIILLTSVLFFFVVTVIVLANVWVTQSTKSSRFARVEELPFNRVALVLGTNPELRGGRTNLFFTTRMDAAAELYRKGKVKHFILSGDNGRHTYNEPEAMQQALAERGVPLSATTLDFAGFRTLDSVVRCNKVFGQEKFTVVSQAFHNSRALFIANYYGLEAIAFDAPEVKTASRKTVIREYFAKVKAVLDLYVFKKGPKFLGEKEIVEVRE